MYKMGKAKASRVCTPQRPISAVIGDIQDEKGHFSSLFALLKTILFNLCPCMLLYVTLNTQLSEKI